MEIKISSILLKSIGKKVLDTIGPCSYFEVLSVYFQLVFEQLPFKKAKLHFCRVGEFPPAALGILGLKYYASEFWTIKCELVHFQNLMEPGSK